MEYIAKLVLISVFLGGLALFIGYMTFWGPGLDAFRLGWIDLALLAFATYRMGHMIAYDRIMEPLRQFFAETRPDPTGAGDTVEPKGTGFQQSLGQLICCPTCAGTWAAAAMVYALYLWPDATRVFITIMAVVGAAELLTAASEAWSWTGQNQRTLAGGQMLARKKNIVRIEQQPCEDGLPPIPEQSETRQIGRRIKRVREDR